MRQTKKDALKDRRARGHDCWPVESSRGVDEFGVGAPIERTGLGGRETGKGRQKRETTMI